MCRSSRLWRASAAWLRKDICKRAPRRIIREAVEAELAFDPLVGAANITVENMGGEVALNGTVPSYPQYLQAAAAAQRVAGVRNVHNHLEVVLPPGDHRDDDVEATARDGNLTLTGMVKYGRQRDAAERAVAGLTGVRNIREDIDISYDADPLDVTWLVRRALDRNALVEDNSDVYIDTSGNTVTLRGHVRTWAEHDAVVGAACMAGGVLEVRDDLDITG
jgi:osmotically-inducible protein OsmY